MRLFTIAPEHDFLDVLADEVLRGFPLEADEARVPFSRWRILVPTRRAARSLNDVFARKIGPKAALLPRITPFGDVDEDELHLFAAERDLDPGLSAAGQLHLLLGLVKQWAGENPQEAIANDLRDAPTQQVQMAISLQELVNQIETEEASFDKLADTHPMDVAFHHGSVLPLFNMLSEAYPARLHDLRRMSPAARRNRLISLEAERYSSGAQHGPVIAAGSTGSNPATRRLLQVIAAHPMGAVIFPGLDPDITTEDWQDVAHAHPFYAMKSTLAAWSMRPDQVKPLGPAAGMRSRLIWEAMVPSGRSEKKPATQPTMPEGLTLVQARDQAEEAHVIALRLRRHAIEEDGIAALITPDRGLAARVKAALARWHMTADDSAGEPLANLGYGALLLLLLRARQDGFAAPALLALLHHADCSFGLAAGEAARSTALLEIACVRGKPFGVTRADLASLVDTARREVTADPHAHLCLSRATAEDWNALAGFVARINAILSVSHTDRVQSLADHVEWLEQALEGIAPETESGEHDTTREAVARLLEGLKADATLAPAVGFEEAAVLIEHHLRRATLRPPQRTETRILVLGLAEARLVPLQLAILGGLNEGTWPDVPETGPWLSRKMRRDVGLEMPERDIGLTAHDFVQGLARSQAMVTWSERAGSKPVLPSRLVLRLRTALEGRGLAPEAQLDQTLLQLARKIDQPSSLAPAARPQARPPVAVRPTHFSVTAVETLVRDSYQVYARRVLGLEPLPGTELEPDHGLRGSLIHAALAQWANDPYTDDREENLRRLLARGEEVFRPLMHLPEVARFWWVRFQRMARAFILLDADLRANMAGIRTEISGAIPLDVMGVQHTLTARADRIDILQNGTLRLIDYKSGSVPSMAQVKTGFAAQLPLEAVIAAEGGFKALQATKTTEAYYISVSGGREPAKLEQRFKDKIDFETLPAELLKELVSLLAAYQLPSTTYIPRHNLTHENERSDFDHLSRRREWEQSGGGA